MEKESKTKERAFLWGVMAGVAIGLLIAKVYSRQSGPYEFHNGIVFDTKTGTFHTQDRVFIRATNGMDVYPPR